MKKYEVFTDSINPCGGVKHGKRDIMEVEAESPLAYVQEHGRWPIIETFSTPENDLVFVTGDCHGNFMRYVFPQDVS